MAFWDNKKTGRMLIGLLAALIAISALIWFLVWLIRNPIYPAVIGGLSIVIFIGYWWYKVATESRQKARREEESRQEQARRETLARQFETAVNSAIVKSFCIIDSNIWMHEKYDNFFEALLDILVSTNSVHVLYGPQFDEICNLKIKHEYDHLKNRRARCAINRIERFQLSNCLRIKPITLNSERDAYADPLIIKLLEAVSKRGKKVTLLSDDKELRIRMRERLRDLGNSDFEVIEAEELVSLAQDYCYVRNLTSPLDINGAIAEEAE